MEDAPRVINGTRRVATRPAAGAGAAALTLVPSYPDLPMEEVYAREKPGDQPECYSRRVGKGRVVYFPFDLDRTFWEVMSPDHGALLRNAVAWATDEAPVVEVKGPGLVDVTVWRQAGSMTVHLVNLTNPMMMKGPYREVIPMGPFTVTLPGVKAKAVRLLTAGVAAKWRATKMGLECSVPVLGLHEVVAVDL